MPAARPTTVDAYLEAAPEAGLAHLRRLRAILRGAAPDAEEVIKWSTPFYVEPRFLFSFSAHKAHLGFTPSLVGLEPYRERLTGYEVTKAGILKVRYGDVLPEAVIREVAEARVAAVAARVDDSFW